MKKTLSFILIIPIFIVLVAGLLLVIPSEPAYAIDISYYLNAEALFEAVNAGESCISLLSCSDDYDNELYLIALTFEEMGFNSVGFCLLFPEEMIIYYCSSDLAVPEMDLYIPQGYTEYVDTSTGELFVDFTVIDYDERFIQTAPFDYSDGMPEFSEELTDEDITFIGYITPYVTFIKSLAPITQNIFDLFYSDGFTPVGLVFIYFAGFGLAFTILFFVLRLWRFNG